jgi:hypothetical protein
MPCYTSDPGPSPEEIREAKMPAVLCGLLRKHGLSVLDGLDWDEIGVSRYTVESWWAYHQKQDEARRRREAECKAARAKKADALAKLSPSERAILGLGDGDD